MRFAPLAFGAVSVSQRGLVGYLDSMPATSDYIICGNNNAGLPFCHPVMSTVIGLGKHHGIAYLPHLINLSYNYFLRITKMGFK